MGMIIKNAVVFNDGVQKVSILKDLVTKGGDKLFAKLSTKPGMLQRPLQDEEWKKNNYERCQGYMHTLFMGAGKVDNIILVPVALVIQSLKIKREQQQHDIPEKTWDEVLGDVQSDINNGVEYYIIDGQNRLINAIRDYYEDVFPLGKKELIAIDTKTNKEIYLAGKRYSDLSKGCKSILDDTELNVLIAKQGQIDELIDVLVSKNKGVNWTEWMIQWNENWFSRYRNDLEKTITSDPIVNEMLNKVNGKEYLFDKYGHALITSELLVWMEKKHQLTKYNDHMPYILGIIPVKSSHFKNLKTYIKEMRNGYFNKKGQCKKIHNVELRNYVMFRYAIDYPKQFSKIFTELSLPSFEVNMKTDFVARFRQYDKTLKADPNNYIKNKKFKKKVKAPGHYIYANSEKDRDSIELRLKLLFKEVKKDLDYLKKMQIIKIVDDTPMPSLEVVALNNLTEISTKRKLRPSEALSGDYHRGHKKARKNNGTNDLPNIGLHEANHNMAIKDTDIGG